MGTGLERPGAGAVRDAAGRRIAVGIAEEFQGIGH
jgi:hypothetical protein